jgi:hypothetical protein
MAKGQGRRSSLEAHPQREAIFAEIARKRPVKLIAQTYGVTTYCIYRWIQSNRPREDRQNRAALRKLKKTVNLMDHTRNWPELSGNDVLPEKMQELERQRERLLAVQDTALRTGDLRQVTLTSDTLARLARHSVALAEILRTRQQPTHLVGSHEYKRLRSDLLHELAKPGAAVEQAKAVLDRFESGGAAYEPDELERLY